MIDIKNKILEEPYLQFYDCYEAAVKANQFAVEAIAISSFNKNKNEVESRFVNLNILIMIYGLFFQTINQTKPIILGCTIKFQHYFTGAPPILR